VTRAGLVQRGSGKIGGLSISALSHLVPARGQPRFLNGSCSEPSGADNAVRRAFSRARSWRPPPHWSERDWHDEVRAIIDAGASCARLNYDPVRGVPLRAFVYMRTIAAAWKRYRQEWSYYLHVVAQSAPSAEPITTPCDQAGHNKAINHSLAQALSQLSMEDQYLIRRLFWDDADHRRVAVTLQISQQGVSRRKAHALRQLRRVLSAQSQVFSHLVTACWALLDSLDLLPGIDLL
jgi:Sigma-70, region 4